jgi:outer membrane lipoprotein-sorting protein
VVLKSDLGLPSIPIPRGDGSGSASLGSLINGSHTLRVWYSGPDKARIALLDTLGETDVITNGHDVWVWSSRDQSAQHRTLPPHSEKSIPRDASELLPTTPQQAADQVLAALDPSTVVSTAGTGRVAGRAAYELVLAPRDANSLVSQVRLAIDGEQHVPLRVRVFAKGNADPAFEVGFQQVSFARPGNEHFQFNPPPGTKVEEAPADTPNGPAEKKPNATDKKPNAPEAAASRPVVIGSGWTSVLVARLPQGGLSAAAEQGNPVAGLLQVLPKVSGAWGSGSILKSKLFSVLITDDGRVLVGAVSQERLFAAAADPAAAVK